MRKLTPIDLRPWTLPFIVLGLILPVAVAALLLGPAAAFLAGAVAATVVAVLAARAQYDEPIEVARAADDRYRVLVVATEPVEDPRAAEAIAGAAAEGAQAVGSDPDDADVLVLAPALNRGLSHWLSDLGEARLGAQRRLAVSLASLAAARVDARGQVGDTDPVQALEDTLASFPAREVIFVTAAGRGAKEVEEVRRRLDRPVRHLEEAAPMPAPERPEVG